MNNYRIFLKMTELYLSADEIVYKRAIFATIPIFMSYAGMITLQRSIKEKIGNPDENMFGIAVGNIYLGNLIFRLLHNFVFSGLVPRWRVVISYILACCSHLIIGLAYWVFDSKSLAWVFLAYLMAGVSIGTFEANLLSCITPLGHETKSWAVIGIPIGFNSVSIGFYVLFSVFEHDAFLHAFPYFMISSLNLLVIPFFLCKIPYVEFESTGDDAEKFISHMKNIKVWFDDIKTNSVALLIDMFFVSMFSSIVYYLYSEEEMRLFGSLKIQRNMFQTWFNFFAFLGDFSSRKLAYYLPHKPNVLFFLLFSLIGAVGVLSRLAFAAPFGIFCVMFANGSIYAHTTKKIDNLDPSLNLLLLSIWLFVGDVGSYSASLAVQPFQEWITGTNSTI